ncbi:MAG: helix-turn-helix domain-containing protein [Phycisphaerales bacterium]|nr:helix-turn-helix domain-containing protein [Phycisphaerales bacterium]
MAIYEEFGKRVRLLRDRQGITQEELGARAGFHSQRISEFERGEANCTLETIERLAAGLKCEPAELFLFAPKAVGKSLSLLDARLIDIWKAADDQAKRKAIRILSELL